jgi:hypothetical protein
LGFGGFPGGGHCPFHRTACLEGILLAVTRPRVDNFRNMLLTVDGRQLPQILVHERYELFGGTRVV